jgi:hypothetical protein
MVQSDVTEFTNGTPRTRLHGPTKPRRLRWWLSAKHEAPRKMKGHDNALDRLGSCRARLGPIGPSHPRHPWAATDLAVPPSARGGPKGGRRATKVNRSAAGGSRPETAFRTRLSRSRYRSIDLLIDKLRRRALCCARAAIGKTAPRLHNHVGRVISHARPSACQYHQRAS